MLAGGVEEGGERERRVRQLHRVEPLDVDHLAAAVLVVAQEPAAELVRRRDLISSRTESMRRGGSPAMWAGSLRKSYGTGSTTEPPGVISARGDPERRGRLTLSRAGPTWRSPAREAEMNRPLNKGVAGAAGDVVRKASSKGRLDGEDDG